MLLVPLSSDTPAFFDDESSLREMLRIVLRRETWTVPGSQAFGDAELVPMRAGETVAWRLVS